MVIVHVHIIVKPHVVDAFREATLENAQNSVAEPGVARFDVLQQVEQPNQFTLVEVYKTADAPADHKKTAHYQKWRDTVESMMVEPRRSVRYDNVFPDDAGWA